MDILRTPDEHFENLPDFAFEPHYVHVDGMRMHYVDEGPGDGDIILMLHGEPSWSFLYRKMIPIFVEAGFRAIAPDLIGFGRSDKPARKADYSYQKHVDWVRGFLTQLDLTGITLVCQDWGGLIGLRLLAEHPDRFARVTAANTGLPTGVMPVTDAFLKWRTFSQEAREFDIATIVDRATTSELSDAVRAAYNAPFPDDRYKAGARIFPSLVPISPDDPAAEANKAAWKILFKSEIPILTAFSDQDPITRHGDRLLQASIPGAKDQPHTTIKGAGHFLQEDRGEEWAHVIVDWCRMKNRC